MVQLFRDFFKFFLTLLMVLCPEAERYFPLLRYCVQFCTCLFFSGSFTYGKCGHDRLHLGVLNSNWSRRNLCFLLLEVSWDKRAFTVRILFLALSWNIFFLSSNKSQRLYITLILLLKTTCYRLPFTQCLLTHFKKDHSWCSCSVF